MDRAPRRFLQVRALGWLAAGLAAVGCNDDRVIPADGGSASSGAEPGPTTSTSEAMGTSGTSGTGEAGSTSGTTTTGAADDTASSDTGALFLPPPGDVGDAWNQCDVFAQDCPPDLKCNFQSTPDTGDWRLVCTPLSPAPVPAGQPCHVQEYDHSGIDDCERGAMCWDVDPETLEGVCVNLCQGSDADPICEDPGEFCQVTGAGPMPFCMPVCDPLEADCPADYGCYALQDYWECLPDASGDVGAYGDPCEFINSCDPGLTCVDASTVPSCAGPVGCCTPVCSLSDPAGDLQCPGAAEGQTCVPWDEQASPQWEDVGVCVLPQ